MSENEAIVRPPPAPFPDRGVVYHAAGNLKERVKRTRSRRPCSYVMNTGEL